MKTSIYLFLPLIIYHTSIYSEFTYKKIINKKNQSVEKVFYKNKKEVGKIIDDRKTFKRKIEGVIPQGLVKFYDPDSGILKEEVSYANGKKNGIAKIYDKYGFIKQVSFYKNDILDGLVQIYKDNKISQEWNYKDGFLNGIAKNYDKNGNLKKTGIYKKDQLNGTVSIYYPNSGFIKKQSIYENDKKNGFSRNFYENGVLSSESFYKNGKLEGVFRSYYQNEDIKQEMTYKNGVLHGYVKNYYRNNVKLSEEIYINGKKNGVARYYDKSSGRLIQEVNYKDDILDGEAKIYDADGKLRKLSYKNGKVIQQKQNEETAK